MRYTSWSIKLTWHIKDEDMMNKIPVYKMKWFVGSKVQIDLIIYIVSMCLLSQLLVFSHDVVEASMIDESYSQYFIVIIQIAYFGCILYGLWLTNRIAGPLVHLKAHMDAMAEGKTDSELHFRKNDYNLELAESFNGLVKKRINVVKGE
jgi:signal transduction histidine kinase